MAKMQGAQRRRIRISVLAYLCAVVQSLSLRFYPVMDNAGIVTTHFCLTIDYTNTPQIRRVW